MYIFKIVQFGDGLQPKLTKQSTVIPSWIRRVYSSCIVSPCHAPDIKGNNLQRFVIVLASLLLGEN